MHTHTQIIPLRRQRRRRASVVLIASCTVVAASAVAEAKRGERKEGRTAKESEGRRRRDDRIYTYNVDPSSTVSGGGGAKNGWKVVGVRRLLRRTGEITLANRRRRPHFVGKHFA